MFLIDRPTQYFDAPPYPRPIRFIGLHHTGTPISAWPYGDGSWHYQVTRTATVYREVREEMVAWGMRAADRWRFPGMPTAPRGFTDPNWCGIHIEMVSDDGTYTEPQLQAVFELLADIRARRGLLPIYAHGELQTDKWDPAGFPWHRVHKEDGRMDVPFISQLEANGSGYNNCGPACLTMAMAYAGLLPGDQQAMHLVADWIRDGVYDGDWWLGTYTDYPMMQSFLTHEFGRGSTLLRSWDQVHAALANDQPVILLVDNSVLAPRLYPQTAAWNAHHFILLTGISGANYGVNDPLAYFYKGPANYTQASVQRGAANVGGVFALTLDPVEEDVSPEDKAILDLMHGLNANADSVSGWINEIGALRGENLQLHGEVAGRDGIISEYAGQVEALRSEVSGLRDQLGSAQKPEVAGVAISFKDGTIVSR